MPAPPVLIIMYIAATMSKGTLYGPQHHAKHEHQLENPTPERGLLPPLSSRCDVSFGIRCTSPLLYWGIIIVGGMHVCPSPNPWVLKGG
mmetsp:Transcript_16538/g.19047  ORF Transcript_16538/g.19047 Transcript_16538/m.19047 type:complete len:89 (-) Transcript_16538:224-490(-)